MIIGQRVENLHVLFKKLISYFRQCVYKISISSLWHTHTWKMQNDHANAYFKFKCRLIRGLLTEVKEF